MKNAIIMLGAVLLSSSLTAQLKLNPKNIDAVIKEMTIEEKANMLVGYTFGKSYWGLPTNPDPNAGAIVLGAAGNTAKNDRFGIPHTVFADGPAGVHISAERPNDQKKYYCSGFPIGTLLASTWDTELVNAIGSTLGSEVKEYGVDVILGPGMNLMRNPLCGRNFEYYSEDPFVSGLIAAAIINGIQSKGVGVSAKHFAANNQEGNRTHNNVIASQRVLRELYLKGFEIMVKKSQPWTIMSSYNYINGVYTQESEDLLTTILRDEWGFKNLVLTDWTNTRNTAAQVHAGNDLLTPGNAEQIKQIADGLKNGSISMADVDRNLKRVLEYIVKTPRFNGYKFSNNPDLKAHAEIIRKAAPQGMVLLKNEGNALPLASSMKKAALFGHTSYHLYAGGSGSGDVNKPYVVDLVEGLKNAGIRIDDTLNTVYSKYRDYAHHEAESEMGAFSSSSYFPRPRVKEPQMGIFTYANAAERNEFAIVTVGRSSGEGNDRAFEDFNINADELDMLKQTYEAFHKKGKKVIVILNVGGVIETAPVQKYSDAILLAWQPGMEAGNSIADVLTGKTAPSGKLTMTWPEALADVPSTKNFPNGLTWRDEIFVKQDEINKMPNLGETRYDEGLDVGYRYFQTAGKKTAYPFGFGMNYTQFEYANASVKEKNGVYTASVTVKNIGKLSSREAVQLYITAPKGKLAKPVYELKAFGKTKELQPGESQKIEMTFTNYYLASYDESEQAFVTDKGVYVAHFAASADDIRQNVNFKAVAQTVKCHDVLKLQP
ncbi:glycoside hydrolase family 3 C-terminal domain-containing protein [Flavobacterium ginsenosidimutans]|uniref:glycoside hydrolase family 3 C-terminal domain-containing protein n=1 Tax=Flavobacterium ginsenosidimutans TaxID=687844 RepID=UPI000DAB7D00|nr:glycoside hydrolase family 3 C-terminal domain-containing protein [Flavobacterium ginsenosidimutans]KAF2328149.1 beta-glucosidase [Flavobacterium ginsenosidimutans]